MWLQSVQPWVSPIHGRYLPFRHVLIISPTQFLVIISREKTAAPFPRAGRKLSSKLYSTIKFDHLANRPWISFFLNPFWRLGDQYRNKRPIGKEAYSEIFKSENYAKIFSFVCTVAPLLIYNSSRSELKMVHCPVLFLLGECQPKFSRVCVVSTKKGYQNPGKLVLEGYLVFPSSIEKPHASPGSIRKPS